MRPMHTHPRAEHDRQQRANGTYALALALEIARSDTTRPDPQWAWPGIGAGRPVDPISALPFGEDAGPAIPGPQFAVSDIVRRWVEAGRIR